MHRLLIAKEPEADIERSEPDCEGHNAIYPVAAPYMQQVAALNVIEPWTHISIPVLAIYGTADDAVAPADHQRSSTSSTPRIPTARRCGRSTR